MDETSQKIVDAAMTLIRDLGYVSTTTKEIARVAGVNECTLFRKFKNKKDIILQGLEQEQWRAPQLYGETASFIMKVPQAFLSSFTEYLNQMCMKGNIAEADFDALAMNFFSATFGYTFLKASFGNKLTTVEKDEYIQNCVTMFIKGLE